MNEFIRQVYLDMTPVDRVLLLMVKVRELFELQRTMGKEDMQLLKRLMEKEAAHD